MVDEPNHEIVMAPRLNAFRAVLDSEAGLAELPTNLDLTTEKGRCMATAALCQSDLRLNDDGEITLEVSHYIRVPDEGINDKTGEVEQFSWLVLFTPEGKTFGTTGVVAPKQWHRICRWFGNGPWEPPLIIHVRERKSRKSGFDYHELRVLPRV